MTAHNNEVCQPGFEDIESSLVPDNRRIYWGHKRLFACWTIVLLAAWFGPMWVARGAQWQACQQLVAREPEKALWWLDLAAAVIGTNSEERFLRARAQRKLGRLDLTKKLLVHAFELGYPRDRLEREQWLCMAQTGQLRQAEPHLVQLLTDPQGDVEEICEAFVNGFGMNYRFEDALKVLDAWISDYGQDPYPYYLRGRIFRIQKSNDQAAEDFRRAIQLRPNYHAAALELGEIYFEELSLDQALQYFQIAQKANSEVGRSAQVGKAQCYRKLGQSEKARQTLCEVLVVEPSNLKALLELSHIDLEERRPEQALLQLQQAYARDSRNIEVRTTLAHALQATGNFEEAREHFKYVEAQLALNFRKEGLIKHLSSRLDDWEARYELGSIYLQVGWEEKGLQWLASVLNYDANHRPTIEALAQYHSAKAMVDPKHQVLADRFRRQLATLPESTQRSGSTIPE